MTVTTPIRLVLDIDVSLVPSSSVNVWLTGLHAPVPSSSRHRQARPSRHRTDRRSLPPASRCGHGRSASLSVSAGLGCLHPLPDLDRKPSGTQSQHALSSRACLTGQRYRTLPTSAGCLGEPNSRALAGHCSVSVEHLATHLSCGFMPCIVAYPMHLSGVVFREPLAGGSRLATSDVAVEEYSCDGGVIVGEFDLRDKGIGAGAPRNILRLSGCR